jgi:hypothetical protein
MAKKENKASQSEGSKRKKTTSSQASSSAKKAGTGPSASASEGGAGASAEAGNALYSTGDKLNAGSGQGSQGAWQSGQEQQTPWNSSSGYGNRGSQQQQQDQQQQGGGMGYPGNQGGFGSPQGHWNEDRNQGHQAGQYQQQEHWDKSDDSLKHHGLEGNRNAPDWERTTTGNRGENRGNQQWEQPAYWNQQADWNRGAGNASWQGEQRDYQGGGVYHSGGEYRQQQQQYSGYGQGSGQANQHWQGSGNRWDEESNRGRGTGTYFGQQYQERGRSGSEGTSYENSGYGRFYEMGGYDPHYRREEERYSGSTQHRGYGSGARGSYRHEHQERSRPYGGPGGSGNYSEAYDRDSHFSAGGISSMGGDYDREGSRGRQYPANYDSAGNFIGSYDRREGMGDSREWRQDSDRGGSRYNSGFDRNRQDWNQEYERQRRDSGWGSERGGNYDRTTYGQRQDPWGVPGRGDSDSRYRGYPSSQSNYAGSGSYGESNRYGRSDSYGSDRNRGRSADYERNQEENRRRGPKRFNTGDDAYDYRDYGAAPQEYNRYRGHQEEEGFLDKAADRVRSWFGGREEDQHRR